MRLLAINSATEDGDILCRSTGEDFNVATASHRQGREYHSGTHTVYLEEFM